MAREPRRTPDDPSAAGPWCVISGWALLGEPEATISEFEDLCRARPCHVDGYDLGSIGFEPRTGPDIAAIRIVNGGAQRTPVPIFGMIRAPFDPLGTMIILATRKQVTGAVLEKVFILFVG